jgi:hypothetical protein
LSVTPAHDRGFKFASRLPGPAKLTRAGSMPALRTIASSPPEAMSKPSTNPKYVEEQE